MKLFGEKPHIWRRILIALVVILVAAALIFWFLSTLTQRKASDSSQNNTGTVATKPVSVSSNTLFMGDTYWGRYVNDWSQASELKTQYPFSRLHEFNREKYDAWIANLECPTVADFSQTSAQEDATLSFNCSPNYLPEAAKWFTAVSLANNHTDNRGAAGFTETQEQLAKNNIQYFGTYDPVVAEDACEIIALPVSVKYSNDTTKRQKLPVAMCGYNGVFKIPQASAIAEITKYSKYMPVVVMPHMGAEYKTSPDALRQTTYRAMIDAGADMVIGNHPHWVQSTEAYKGKLIVYSMGNFIFDQQANSEVTRSALINVVFTSNSASGETLNKWLALGEVCASYKDDCLAQAEAKNLQKIPMTIHYGALGSSSANKITKPASEAETQAILQRLNWQETMSQLQLPQSSL